MKIQRSRRNMEVRRARAAEVQKPRQSLTNLQQLQVIEERTKRGLGESKREKERLQKLVAVNVEKVILAIDAVIPEEESPAGPKKLKAKERRAKEKHQDS